MNHWLNYLPHRPNNLSSVPRTSLKRVNAVAHICNPRVLTVRWEVEPGKSPCLYMHAVAAHTHIPLIVQFNSVVAFTLLTMHLKLRKCAQVVCFSS